MGDDFNGIFEEGYITYESYIIEIEEPQTIVLELWTGALIDVQYYSMEFEEQTTCLDECVYELEVETGFIVIDLAHNGPEQYADYILKVLPKAEEE